MNSFILPLLFCQTFFGTYAASSQKIRSEDDRVLVLNQVIESSRSTNVETDRHMHLDWDSFRELKEEFDAKFEELICTDPDQLTTMQEELDRLSKRVELGWELKQEQLVELEIILHDENYTASGLSTGNDGVNNLCQGLQEYIDKVNNTAWVEEKPELDTHLQEVIEIKIKIETHPCDCEWGLWTVWSDCTTTCEAGSRNRKRVIAKEAINNGTECAGDDEDFEVCNADICCPVNCVWNPWGDWNPCPSGCNQKKIRTRTKAVEAECDGIDCAGMDYHEESCSRERELEDEVTRLEEELETCSAYPTQPYTSSTELPWTGTYPNFVALG